ncbi:hypothetical protein A1OE_849 [Candidatus Endolissoclinum faulkneri L2]|uniref:Uncharacterized protein n=1 Tax=Candidatus Endolissoclinum faulkneri L2 TaxID=1193729 RepID=K7YR78_9PROT|nr:hypothetical protein A1OE_849 [Candidatus Endolissoclinum faulkneri L2]
MLIVIADIDNAWEIANNAIFLVNGLLNNIKYFMRNQDFLQVLKNCNNKINFLPIKITFMHHNLVL